MMPKFLTRHLLELCFLVFAFFTYYIVFLNNSFGISDLNNSDIHWEYQWGVSVYNDLNPYLKTNTTNLLIQEKVPGLLPLYFYYLGGLANLADYNVNVFFDALRIVVFFANCCVALVLYSLLRKENELLAAFSVLFVLFNRWNLGNALFLKQDAAVLLLVLLSLAVLEKKKYLSFALFGVATGLKHLTIFLLPLYLLFLVKPIIKDFQEKRLQKAFRQHLLQILLMLVLMAAPVVLPSLKFLQENPAKFTSSIIYNLTRESEGSAFHTGLDRLLVLYNQDTNNSVFYYMLNRLPLFVAAGFCIVLLYTGKISKWKYCLLVYVSFTALNPVFFGQYETWVLTFLPLGLFMDAKKYNPAATKY